MPSHFIAFNWKMNATKEEASDLFKHIASLKAGTNEVVVIPPFVYLEMAERSLPSFVSIGAQDVSSKKRGAHTGEISAAMLKSVGVRYVLVGHSERREYFLEGKGILAEKIERLHEDGLTPIYCIGENRRLRESGKYFDFLKNQVLEVLTSLKKASFVLAYEPVWSIGSSKAASVKEIEEATSFLREVLKAEGLAATRIIYGGSVNSSCVKDILSSGVDGVLVGGSSIKKEELSFLTLA